jgi:hypothetical protein
MAKNKQAVATAPEPVVSDAEEGKKDKVAKREWITRTGEVTKDEATVSGFRYTLTNGPYAGDMIEHQFESEPGSVETQCGVFGALTKVGNETNTHKAKTGEITLEPARAFWNHLVETRQWGVPSTGGGGPRINFERLVAAVHGRADELEAAGGTPDRSKSLGKLGEAPDWNVDYAKELLRNPNIERIYKALAGGKVTADEDIF